VTKYNIAIRELVQTLRFGSVGVVGFAVDAGILALLDSQFHEPLAARAISAPTAILVTFALNRYWSFHRSSRQGFFHALAAYLSVQSTGFALNLLVYALVLTIVRNPIFALFISSIAAMSVNYVGARFWVFRR
jgi:putative flippase GtrA